MARSMFDGSIPEHAEVLSETRGWILVRHAVSGGWHQLKLAAKIAQPKGNYWLAWNGERLAMSSDAKKLNTYHPDVYDWVVEVMERLA